MSGRGDENARLVERVHVLPADAHDGLAHVRLVILSRVKVMMLLLMLVLLIYRLMMLVLVRRRVDPE